MKPRSAGDLHVMRSEIPNRSVALHFVATLLTGGQYGIFWVFLMAHDIKHIEAGFVPRLHLITKAFAAFYIAFMGLVAYDINELLHAAPHGIDQLAFVPDGLLASMAFLMLAVLFYLIYWVANYIRSQGVQVPSNLILIALLFVYGSTFPLLQSKLNYLHARNA